MPTRYVLVTRNDWEDVCRAVTKINNVTGPGVVSTPTSLTISPVQPTKPAPSVPQRPGMFPVQCVEDGGNNGNATTPATFTYSIFNMNADTETDDPIAESLTPLRQRDVGEIISGDGQIGTAIYLAGQVALLDAGEIVKRTAECPES